MLLDTCIVIDLLRGKPAAMTFIDKFEAKPTLSVITVTELFAGVKAQRLERSAQLFVSGCSVVGVDQSIAQAAGSLLRHYRASHGTEIADALIAATADYHGLALATLNVKHFPMFKKLKPAY